MSWVRVAVLLLAALPLALFAFYYNRYSPLWRRTLQGRTLMAQEIAMLLVVVNSAVSVVFDYPGERPIGLVLFTLLAVLFWVMFVSLRLAQRRPGDRKQKEK